MKKRVLYVLFVELFLFSVCQAKPITADRAAIVAGNFLTSKGFSQKKLVLHNNKSGSAHIRSLSGAAPAYHIFTMAGEAGIVIVSGDDIAKPILGYSCNGTLEDGSSLPPNMQAWLDDMENQIMQARKEGVQQSEETAQQWVSPTVGAATLQLKTALWHQRSPFNQQCPFDNGKRSVSGCVPTSYAILMKYYGYPSKGRGTTKDYVVEKNGITVEGRNLEHSYNWDMMLLEYNDGQYTQAQAKAVAELLADIGSAIKANYSAEATGATTGHKDIFAHFGLNPGNRMFKEDFTTSEWNSMMKNELNKSRPVLYSASASEDSGHAFIIDGYINSGYFNVNWGWGGNYNGSYTLDALTPGDRNYKSSQQAYFDCVPATMLPCVAKVNNTEECPSLKAAFSMASIVGSPTSITMIQDAPISDDPIDEDDNIILDLNGRKLDVHHYGIYNHGQLRVMDNKGSGKIVIKYGNSSIFNNYGVMSIENGEYINDISYVDSIDYRRCIWSSKGSSTTIKNGKFTSTFEVMCLNGDATIEKGDYKSTGNGEVILNYNSSGSLTILGGTFTNNGAQPNQYDYRRCIWSCPDSKTIIKNGKFTSPYQVFCFKGDATIENGDFISTGNNETILNYNTSGQLTILGGTFTNTSQQSVEGDNRRIVWSIGGSKTLIKNGKFTSPYQALGINGDVTIENGEFTTTGNTAIISNYNMAGELIIKGGTFINKGPVPDDSDYRRCIWTIEGSLTKIEGGTFTNDSKTQTFCFNGNAKISGGIIENKGTGITCASNANVSISNGMISGNRILYTWSGASLKCSGGVYSQKVSDSFLASGCYCSDNKDAATKQKYPYIVINPVGMEEVPQSEMSEPKYYGIDGMILPDKKPGLIIIRDKNGKTVKRFSK